MTQRGPLTDFGRLAGGVVDLPDARAAVARARDDEAAVAREIERVDLLLVPLEHRPDALLCNVPNLQYRAALAGSRGGTGDDVEGMGGNVGRECIGNKAVTHPNLLVLGTGSKVLSVWAEAHAPDIQISGFAGSFIRQYAVVTESDDLGAEMADTNTDQVLTPVFVS